MPPRRRTDPVVGSAALSRAVAALDAGADADRADLKVATRYLLEELAERAEGNSVEIRVPPYGVTQAVAGPRHTRGTPPNVVECDAVTWLLLATGRLAWAQAVTAARLSASGDRSDISAHLPLQQI